MPYQDWLTALTELTQEVRQLVPSLLGASALILIGLILGRILQSWSRRLTTAALQRLSRNTALRGALDRTQMPTAAPRIVGAFVFWLVALFFVAAGLEVLGLPVVTDSINRFVYYLPNVLAAALIVVAGLVVAGVARGAVTAAAASARVEFGPVLGRIVHSAILLVAVVVGLEELGIDSSALVVMLTVVFGSMLAAVGLAFGLGARTTVSNIIASHYLARSYQVGQTVRIAGVEGQIIETTPTAVVLATEHGKVLVPANKFSEESSLLLDEAKAP